MGMLTTNDLKSASPDEPEMIRVRLKNPPQPTEVKGKMRFENWKKGDDIVILAKPGRNILNLGDENGIKIPRACRSGLCGTCTADLEDPSWAGGDGTGEGEGGIAGTQIIRCCSTGVMVPSGCEEMVIDLYRNSGTGGKAVNVAKEEISNPMARFDDGWETAYVSDSMKGDKDGNDRKRGRAPPKGGYEAKKDVSRRQPQATGGRNVAPWDKLW
jgi:ferredoxin